MNAKFLERQLEKYDAMRVRFYRFLGFACLLIALFQVFVFFQYFRAVYDRGRVTEEIRDLSNAKTVFAAAEKSFSVIGSSVEEGGAWIRDSMRDVPSRMRRFLEYVGSLESTNNGNENIREASNGFQQNQNSRSNSTAVQQLQSEQPALRLRQRPTPPAWLRDPQANEAVAALSDSDWNTLTERIGKSNPKAYRDTLRRLVNEYYVVSLFDSLRAGIEIKLTKPASDAIGEYKNIVLENRESLKRREFRTEAIDNDVESIAAKLAGLQIRPPSSDEWWYTYAGKTQVSAGIIAQNGNDEQALQHMVTQSSERLLALERSLSQSLATAQEKEKENEAMLTELSQRLSEIQKSVNSYFKPIPVLALSVKDGVIYYPAFIAAAFACFTWLYIRLKEREKFLTGRYEKLGLSTDLAKSYFRSTFDLAAMVASVKSTKDRLRAVGAAFLTLLPGMLIVGGIVMVFTAGSYTRISIMPLRSPYT